MQFGHAFVVHAARHLREPVIQRREQHQDRRNAHHHVEMRDHEIGVGQGQVDDHVAEEQTGQSAVDEGEDEADGEIHRRVHADIAFPEGKHPVVDLERRRHRDDQRGRGEEEAEVGVHAADVHVMRPDDEAEQADDDNRPDHHAVAEDVLAGMGAEHVGNEAEGRQRHDIDFRVAEEPEQMLEQDRAAAVVVEGRAGFDHRRHEETGPDQGVEQHHDGRHEQGRESEQAEYGGDEDAPHRQRQAHHGQAAAAILQHGNHVVEAAHGEGDDKHRQRDEHEHDAHVVSRRSRHRCLRRIQRPARPRRAAADKEAGQQDDHRNEVHPVTEHVHEREHHVPGAAHEGNQVVAESAEEQGGEEIDHHDHAVHGHGLVIRIGVDEVKGFREAELHAHEQRQHESDESDGDGGAAVLDGDHLVILAPDVLRYPAMGVMKFDLLVRQWYVCHVLCLLVR